MFRLPMLRRTLKQLFKKPATNPFPAKHLPPSITKFLEAVGEGKASIHPPIEVADGFKGKLVYDKEKGCTGCGLCARVCPANAIEVDRENKGIRVYAGHCIQCEQCTEVCMKGVLYMSKEFLTATTDRYSKEMVLE